jgi:hypothetical protein
MSFVPILLLWGLGANWGLILECSVTVLQIRGVYPGSYFFHLGSQTQGWQDPESRIDKIPDPDPHKRIEVFLTLKIYTMFSKISPRMFIVHPRSWIWIFFPSRIPNPGVKKAPEPGSGSATLLYW